MFVEVGGNVALFADRIEQHHRTKKMPSAVSVARAIFGVTAPSVAVSSSSSSRAQQLKNPVAAAATASSIGTAVDADDASVDNSSNKRRRRGKRSD
jgi:hypothetical protein